MNEVNKLIDIKKINISPYKPNTNGLTEKFNRILLKMLSMFVKTTQKDWNIYISYVYNFSSVYLCFVIFFALYFCFSFNFFSFSSTFIF